MLVRSRVLACFNFSITGQGSNPKSATIYSDKRCEAFIFYIDMTIRKPFKKFKFDLLRNL